jgi:hypothetical protein
MRPSSLPRVSSVPPLACAVMCHLSCRRIAAPSARDQCLPTTLDPTRVAPCPGRAPLFAGAELSRPLSRRAAEPPRWCCPRPSSATNRAKVSTPPPTDYSWSVTTTGPSESGKAAVVHPRGPNCEAQISSRDFNANQGSFCKRWKTSRDLLVKRFFNL